MSLLKNKYVEQFDFAAALATAFEELKIQDSAGFNTLREGFKEVAGADSIALSLCSSVDDLHLVAGPGPAPSYVDRDNDVYFLNAEALEAIADISDFSPLIKEAVGRAVQVAPDRRQEAVKFG